MLPLRDAADAEKGMAARAERSIEELEGNPRPEAAALPEASKEENEYNRLVAALTSTRGPSGHTSTHQRLGSTTVCICNCGILKYPAES